MEWVETTGKSVAEAKDSALDQLGVDESDAEFEVLSDAKTGLFGRLKTEARIRARVKPSAPRSKESNNKRRGRPRRDKNGGGSETSGSQMSKPTIRSDAPFDNGGESKPRRSQPRSRVKREVNVDPDGGTTVTDPEVPLEEQGQVAEDFLAGLFAETKQDVSFERSMIEDEDIVQISVKGEQLGHLIGRRGTTLHSLQELTRTVVQRKTGSRTARIVLDIAGYREKRKEALAHFAREIADAVTASAQPQSLEPMNPADRKIVHDTINEIAGVSTTSEGEEPRRYVVIRPHDS